MKMPSPLIPGILIQRKNRFMAHVRLTNGSVVHAHCPNSGSMKGCNVPGRPVRLSVCDNPKRRTRFTWEMVKPERTWVGINTLRTNGLVREALEDGTLEPLQGYHTIRSEVRFGERSRLDFLLEGSAGSCYVEVKNVTLLTGRTALFPDAVTERGQKHMQELIRAVRQGHRAAVVFVVQRSDALACAPADAIDPLYGRWLRRAAAQGVEVLSYKARVSARSIRITDRIPCML